MKNQNRLSSTILRQSRVHTMCITAEQLRHNATKCGTKRAVPFVFRAKKTCEIGYPDSVVCKANLFHLMRQLRT